jgi:hypothetical protein
LVAGMVLASTVAATAAAAAAAAAVVVAAVAAAATSELVGGSGLVSAEGPDVEVASLALAESIDLVSAGMGLTEHHQVEVACSPIESESSVGDLCNIRQMLPDAEHQVEDCSPHSQADVAGLLDDTDSDTGQHTGPAEPYLGTVVGGPDTLW